MFFTTEFATEGITHVHVTVGETEYKGFHAQQGTLKKANLPHLEVVAGDLSGSLEVKIFLWTQHGTGFNCITRITVKERGQISTEGMKVLVSAAASEA